MTRSYCKNCFAQFTKIYNQGLEESSLTCVKCKYVTESVSDMTEHHRGKCLGSHTTGCVGTNRAVLLLKLERIKNQFYRSLIEQNTDIDIDSIIVDSYDTITFLNANQTVYSDLINKIVGDDIVVSMESSSKTFSEVIVDPDKTGVIVDPRKTDSETKSDAVVKADKTDSETKSDAVVKAEKTDSETKSVAVVKAEKTDSETKSVAVVKAEKTDSETKSVVVKDSPVKKTKYRTIKSCIDLVGEKTEEYWITRVNEIDMSIGIDISSRFDSVSSSLTKINDLLSAIGSNRVYNKYVKQLAGVRRRMAGYYSLSDYMKLLGDHNSKLTAVFKGKRMDEKKISSIVTSSLSAVEAKILKSGEYYKQYSEVDDMQSLSAILDNHVDNNKMFVAFDTGRICENMHNYGTVIFSIKKTIERYLINRYGFYNLIYLPLNKSSEEDPYSFYTLTMVDDKKKRYWSMDCRLEELSTAISASLVLYLVNNFRSIYKAIFGDNDYRSNYESFCPESTEDFTQLTMNIILLSNSKKFCNVLRKIIKSSAVYTPSENDKFNIYGDDPLQRNRFKNDKTEDDDIITVIKQMFDGISQESAKEFYLYTQS